MSDYQIGELLGYLLVTVAVWKIFRFIVGRFVAFFIWLTKDRTIATPKSNLAINVDK
jgi:uncharacterized membrane protein